MKAYAFPGQGSQVRGMGSELFSRFPSHVEQAEAILGYDLRTLCLEDPRRQLSQTRFTQPALYVVNALTFLARREDDPTPPDVVLGHSLGEYDALFAAGAFSFSDGLRLVARRGELMSSAPAGGMAAVLGLQAEVVAATLANERFVDLDIANLNSPTQTVISGPTKRIAAAQRVFEKLGATYIVLNVGAAFHSRAMVSMAPMFREALACVTLQPPAIPVIANVTAAPYAPEDVAETLVAQICAPVRWTESVRWILSHGDAEIHEVGPGKVLASLVKAIRLTTPPRSPEPPKMAFRPAASPDAVPEFSRPAGAFRGAYGLRHACVAAPPGYGLCSPELLAALARAGVLPVIPADAGLAAAERFVDSVQAQAPGRALALALPPALPDPEIWFEFCRRRRLAAVLPPGFDLASGALWRHRAVASGPDAEGRTQPVGRVLAQVRDTAAAEACLWPEPAAIAARVAIEAETGRVVPSGLPADELIILVDGRRPAEINLLPAIRRRDTLPPPARSVGLGVAGDVGTPEAVATLFDLGADFVVTTDLNICTREAAAPDIVKDLLQRLEIDDLAWAPVDGGFHADAWRSVVGRGLFFARRAQRLHEILSRYHAWDSVPAALRAELDQRWLPKPFDELWRDLGRTAGGGGPSGGRAQMAAVFAEYSRAGRAWAAAGDRHRQADFLIEASPGLAAFNRRAKGTELEEWGARSAAKVVDCLMGSSES